MIKNYRHLLEYLAIARSISVFSDDQTIEEVLNALNKKSDFKLNDVSLGYMADLITFILEEDTRFKNVTDFDDLEELLSSLQTNILEEEHWVSDWYDKVDDVLHYVPLVD